MQKVILMDIIPPKMTKAQSLERLRELEALVTTYGNMVIVKRHQRRTSPHPNTYIGPGKIQMLGEEGKALGAKIVIVNHTLKPRQVFAISEQLRPFGVKVWDRIDLILKIFDKHAKTAEAKLEIELASIRHMGPRIFGMGLELIRQGGGIGTRGQGETNTEVMKRHLAARERTIKEKLAKRHRVRREHQASRIRKGFKTAALVGYTNAGKTTLLNALTKRKEYVADALFATLDTRVGRVYLGEPFGELLVSDTIGFIQELPPELLNAFSATLSEAIGADLLLHVIDSADEHVAAQFDVVESILARLNMLDVPRLLVFNKADEIEDSTLKSLIVSLNTQELPFAIVSAKTGEGIEQLKSNITSRL